LRLAGKRSADDVDALFSRHVFEPWPELAATAAARIEATQIRDILARMVHMGIERQTNILRSYLQAAYTHGAHADLDPRRPSQDASRFKLTGNPVSFVPKVTEFERVRERVLNDDELRRVWHGLDGLSSEVALTFRCAILLGGQRFRQLLRATWSDVDVARRVLSLEDSKGRRKAPVPHLLPISDRVATMFDQLRELNGRGNYIFSANAGRTPIHTATLSIAFARLRGKAEHDVDHAVTPMQGRDLRRSVETRLQALGVQRDVRAQLMSHGRTSGVQQRHYERHHFLAEKAAALALLEDHIFRVVAPPKSKRAKVGRPPGRVASTKKSVAKR
jgi:integrase